MDKTVNNAQELRAAVEAARGVTSEYVIELAKDIALTDTPLTISANANVVLISKGTTAMKLIGPKGMNTIHVAGGGKLVLDGIIVTHASGELGRGVYVDFSAALILNSGEITENNIYTGGVTGDAQYGGGVYIAD
ncbi:MAG: hypothetical protein LBH79_08250 [Nitrososphaerota archaeon]|nr:hypothetical protein [Nitrososphaerota archaeon]